MMHRSLMNAKCMSWAQINQSIIHSFTHIPKCQITAQSRLIHTTQYLQSAKELSFVVVKRRDITAQSNDQQLQLLNQPVDIEALKQQRHHDYQELRSCIEANDCDKALEVFGDILLRQNQLLDSRPANQSHHMLNVKFARFLSVVSDGLVYLPKWSPDHALLLAALWDVCLVAKATIKVLVLHVFAMSFDATNDTRRLQGLANYLPDIRLDESDRLSACALIDHILSTRQLENIDFQKYVVNLLHSDPSYTREMLQHQGNISYLLNQLRLDEAVAYLHEHGSSLQISSRSWNDVLAKLCFSFNTSKRLVKKIKLSAQEREAHQARKFEAVRLYSFWLSLLPSIDQLKQQVNYKQIVPSINTFSVLIVGCVNGSISIDDAMQKLDLFEQPLTNEHFETFMKAALGKKDYLATLLLWDHMRKRKLAVDSNILEILVQIIDMYIRQPLNRDSADQLAVLVWDHCVSSPSCEINKIWCKLFKVVFTRMKDSNRLAQLKKVTKASKFSVLKS